MGAGFASYPVPRSPGYAVHGGVPSAALKIVPSVTGLRILKALRIPYGLGSGTGPPPRAFCYRRINTTPTMPRLAALLLACTLALANAPANAQAGATPATPDSRESAHSPTASEPNGAAAKTPTVDDICRALEQSAAEKALPVEFFARVIWQESRFDARAVSPKSVPRERKGSPNSCRTPPVGTASLTRSSQSRRCGIRLLTYENCSTDLATLDSRRQPTMQVQAESAPG